MKFKFLLTIAVSLSILSCKNDQKENLKTKTSKTEKETALKDSIKTDAAAVSLTESDRAGDKRLLQDFFIKNDKKPQFFTINNLKDTTIVCTQKTKITIRANSFISLKTKKQVIGKVTISVKEYYTISDILFGRLSTTSKGKLIETGGMLDLNVFSNDEKCNLKIGKAVEIAFPTKNEKEGMQLFTGRWKEDKIYWNLDTGSINLNKTFSQVDEPALYPGGYEKMYKFIGNNLNNPEDEIGGRVYTSFVIDKQGYVTDVKIIKGLSKRIDEEVIRVIKKLEKFTPGKINGIPVNVTYSLPITFRPVDDTPPGNSRTSSSSNRVSPPSYTTVPKTNENTKADEISYYAFSSTKLGYINCDRFIDYPSSLKTDFIVNIEDEKNVSINIIFHRFKSIIRGNLISKKAIFSDVIQREKVTIVAIKYYENQAFLAVKETTTNQKPENNLVFHPVSPESLKKEMIKLNKFN